MSVSFGIKTDRRYLRNWDTPINYNDRLRKRWQLTQRTYGLLDGISASRMLKAYVRYLDGSRSIDMPIGNALTYLDLFGGRLCYPGAEAAEQAIKEVPIKRMKSPAIGAIYGRKPEAAADPRQPTAAGIERAPGDKSARAAGILWESDADAIDFLRLRGFILDRSYEWHSENDWDGLTDKEKAAINFLFAEWDFGGYSRLDNAKPG